MEIDDRDIGGARNWDWVKKGIPVRVEIGPRDMKENAVFMGRRDRAAKDKESVPRERFVSEIGQILEDIQNNLFERAKKNMADNSTALDDRNAFYDYFTPKNAEDP